MRTKFKNLDYFQNYISLNHEDIQFFEDGIKSGTTKEERIPAVNRQIFTTSIHTLIAKYSSGSDPDEIKKDFPEVINRLEKGWQNEGKKIFFDNYILMLWMLSLGILLEISDDDFRKIVKVLDSSSQKDFLYDTIISSKLTDRKINSEILYLDEFGFLKNLLEKKDIAALASYLNNTWYKKMKSAYWFDNDKNKNDVFFGYWSFESGALVKILGLNDTLLKDQPYYPYDLVHWKD
ncbi:PoNi-like cognate immunity protein [Chryseobacterium sp. SSA4.19]|uniref:PoNe immunity protein domain-containing protein n=1 Tax=Chryseobacterium sp. SSA4.19 TaxID=2919915 RepID=UPI001F4E83D8|nr:PoNe immunity protein domain-containing protein [Chryseobacterium sp. SSA4.19]MCJ8155698.1 PoNi-like cognate immunity protein [Chryseobacterium sp. SSA4.19]